MNDLIATAVVDNVGATHEPIAQPLIRNVGPHAVVRRRGDHPVESEFWCFRLERSGLTAVRQSHGALSVMRASIVALRTPFDHGQDINWLRRKPSRPPEACRIGRLWGVSAGALVGEVAREGFLLRAVQRT